MNKQQHCISLALLLSKLSSPNHASVMFVMYFLLHLITLLQYSDNTLYSYCIGKIELIQSFFPVSSWICLTAEFDLLWQYTETQVTVTGVSVFHLYNSVIGGCFDSHIGVMGLRSTKTCYQTWSFSECACGNMLWKYWVYITCSQAWTACWTWKQYCGLSTKIVLDFEHSFSPRTSELHTCPLKLN